MVGDLVAHDAHDVVTVLQKRSVYLDLKAYNKEKTHQTETGRHGKSEDSELPKRDGSGFRGSRTSVPCAVDDSPRTDRVTDVVGAMSKRCGTGGDDLDERVGVLDLVGVLLGMSVDSLHALTFRSTLNTVLSSMNVVVDTVKSTDCDLGRQTGESTLDVVEFVELTSAHGVVVEKTHGPAERTFLSAELGVELVFGHLLEFSVGVLAGLNLSVLDVVDTVRVGGLVDLGLLEVLGTLEVAVGCVLRVERAGRRWVFLEIVLLLLLNNRVVGNNGLLDTSRCRAAP